MAWNKSSPTATRPNNTTYLVKDNLDMDAIEAKINRLMAVKDKFKKNKNKKSTKVASSSSSTSTVSEATSSDDDGDELNLSTSSTPIKWSGSGEKRLVKGSKSQSELGSVRGILKPGGNRTIDNNSSIRPVEATHLTENTLSNSRVIYIIKNV